MLVTEWDLDTTLKVRGEELFVEGVKEGAGKLLKRNRPVEEIWVEGIGFITLGWKVEA